MYDKKSVYESKILPLVKKILINCDAEKIPVFMTFAVEDDDSETTYRTEMLSSGALGVNVTNDRFPDHALVMNGFKAILPDEIPSTEEFWT